LRASPKSWRLTPPAREISSSRAVGYMRAKRVALTKLSDNAL
jgi:hypothetical protein